MLRSTIGQLVPAKYRPTAIWAREVIAKGQREGVLSGPFRGMRLQTDDTHLPRILGSYEKELHSALESLIAWKPHTILNIGAHTGYYAVGLACRLPQARVVASEMDEKFHPALAEVIQLNRVADRVKMAGACDLQMTRDTIASPGGAIVCDVDGYERELIDVEAVPHLKGAALLIEVHGPAIASLIADRLRPSHTLTAIAAQPRTTADLVYRPWYLTGADPSYLLKERSTDESWLWAVPKG
jgi:hypothetical protein